MKKIDIDINKLDYLASRVISMGNNLTKDTLSVNETNTSQNEDITNDKNW